ncbi:MAG: response regulator [Candidatus Moranbacteria bacterium]|nr:response regulator [Candidatus Moranbacteria bacterium]
MPKKILLVEDNLSAQQEIKTAVQKKGYQVLATDNFTDGLKLLKENDIWLLLSDRYIPANDKEEDNKLDMAAEVTAAGGVPLGELIIKEALKRKIQTISISSFSNLKDQELKALTKSKEHKNLYRYTGKSAGKVISQIDNLEAAKR